VSADLPTPTPRSPRPRSRKPRRLRLALAIVIGLPLLAGIAATTYFYVTFARLVDARLQGERVRALRGCSRGRSRSTAGNGFRRSSSSIGSTTSGTPSAPLRASRRVLPSRRRHHARRTGRRIDRAQDPHPGRPPGARPARADRADGKPVPTYAISRIEVEGGGTRDRIELDRPLLTTLITTNREKRRRVSLTLIPKLMVQAVLAIEDRRFYDHPGIDPSASSARSSPTSRATSPTSRAAARSRSNW